MLAHCSYVIFENKSGGGNVVAARIPLKSSTGTFPNVMPFVCRGYR